MIGQVHLLCEFIRNAKFNRLTVTVVAEYIPCMVVKSQVIVLCMGRPKPSKAKLVIKISSVLYMKYSTVNLIINNNPLIIVAHLHNNYIDSCHPSNGVFITTPNNMKT